MRVSLSSKKYVKVDFQNKNEENVLTSATNIYNSKQDVNRAVSN